MIAGAVAARTVSPRRARARRGLSGGGVWTPAAAVVAAAVVCLWLISGVTAPEIGAYAGYQAIFVLGPGWMVYRWLRPGDGWGPRRLAFSWALGYALECAAFMLTAALDVRSAFLAYPALVAILALLAARRWPEGGSPPMPRLPRPWPWAFAALCVVVLAYVGLQYFATSPLPDRVVNASYGLDSVWNLSLAAEAKHHWPVSDPTVAGTSLVYHLFATFDVAATSQVTGLALPLVLFRLWPVPLIVLACLQLCVFGATAGRRRWAGPVVAVLVLLGSELNIDPHLGYKFANELSDDIIAISPSFLLGLVVFLPVVTVLHELAGDRRLRRRTVVLLALLLFGCAGAKATILPVLLGGLALFVIWRRLRGGTWPQPTLAALSLTALAYLLAAVLIYDAAGGYGLAFDPPGAVRQMPALAPFAHGLHGWLPPYLDWTLAAAVGLAGAYVLFILGAAVQLRRGSTPRGNLLVCMALAGAVPFLAFTHYGFSQVFFVQYGLVALAPLAADGLLWICGELRARARPPRLAVLAGAWLAAIATAAFAVPRWLDASPARQNELFSRVDLILAACAVLVIVRLATARRRPGTIWLWAACALAVTAVVAKPLTTVSPAVTRLAHDQPLYSQTGKALTAGLARGLAWLRDHTDPHAVVAVNNYRDGSLYWDTGWRTPDDYYYSALGERRTFLEGWVYAQRAFDIGEAAVFAGRKVPFPKRLALNEAIFQRADRHALDAVVRRWHVRYLVVDRVHNWATPWLAYLADPVYRNRDIVIYAAPARGGALVARSATSRREPRIASTGSSRWRSIGHLASVGASKP